jgi:sarcosine oxidase subunit beta
MNSPAKVLDSVKLAYEGYFYWKHWKDHIRVHDERGYARLRETGGLILKTESTAGFLSKALPLMKQCGIAVEEW